MPITDLQLIVLDYNNHHN